MQCQWHHWAVYSAISVSLLSMPGHLVSEDPNVEEEPNEATPSQVEVKMKMLPVQRSSVASGSDIYTHLAFWDVFTDDLVDGQGLVFYAFRVWEWESIRLLGSSRRLLPTLNFGWRTTGRTGTITGAGHLNLAINCRLHKLEIGYAWGVGLSLANMRAKRPINP
uniref:HDC15001 n=1 Tax=Drosophila melanogaster TaxID=7227 RepID=Q6IJF4_DROME|nr:TPA_inf: HDC15001 [Drosophila melanogaster]